jgi:uncharacterized integral membrane protein
MIEPVPQGERGGEASEPTLPPDAMVAPAPIGPSNHGTDPSLVPPYTHTRASGYWAAVVVGLLLLLVLLIFILENGQRARVSFFGAHGNLPQGVALLLAAVIGGLFVVLAGAARILQLRSRAHAQTKRKSASSTGPRDFKA